MSMVNCPECNGAISSRAMTCPHCGYPVKTPEVVSNDYVLTTGKPCGSGFASFLKVLAFIAWIGGLIFAIAGANVTVAGYYYSNHTEFSFGTFITLLLPYVFYGIILFCMGIVVEQVADTYGMVKDIRLTKHENKQSAKLVDQKRLDEEKARKEQEDKNQKAKAKLEELKARKEKGEILEEEIFLEEISEKQSMMNIWKLWKEHGLENSHPEADEFIKKYKDMERLYGKQNNINELKEQLRKILLQ